MVLPSLSLCMPVRAWHVLQAGSCCQVVPICPSDPDTAEPLLVEPPCLLSKDSLQYVEAVFRVPSATCFALLHARQDDMHPSIGFGPKAAADMSIYPPRAPRRLCNPAWKHPRQLSCSAGSLPEEMLATWQLFVLKAGKVVCNYPAAELVLQSAITQEGDLVVVLR